MSKVTANKSFSVGILRVLSKKEYKPLHTVAGLRGVELMHLSTQGGLYKIKKPSPLECSYQEEMDHWIDRLQPLISDWDTVDRAITALILQGNSVREIKEYIGTGASRVCSVRKRVQEFLQCT